MHHLLSKYYHNITHIISVPASRRGAVVVCRSVGILSGYTACARTHIRARTHTHTRTHSIMCVLQQIILQIAIMATYGSMRVDFISNILRRV
jgi:hypothetical protein